MSAAVIVVIASLLLLVPVTGMAVQPSSSKTLTRTPCKRPVTAGEDVIVGRYPLHAIVANIDRENATIEYITELGTALQVTEASTDQIKNLHVGDTVDLCIVEELKGEAEV